MFLTEFSLKNVLFVLGLSKSFSIAIEFFLDICFDGFEDSISASKKSEDSLFEDSYWNGLGAVYNTLSINLVPTSSFYIFETRFYRANKKAYCNKLTFF